MKRRRFWHERCSATRDRHRADRRAHAHRRPRADGQQYAARLRHECRGGLAPTGHDTDLCQGTSWQRNVSGFAQCQRQRLVGSERRPLSAVPARQARRLEGRLGDEPPLLQMTARPMGMRTSETGQMDHGCRCSSASTGAALAQSAHQPFLQRNAPPTAWYYDNRDDTRDFQNNGFLPGDFAANPPGAWTGASGLIGFRPAGGSHFGPIYCTRRYRSHNPGLVISRATTAYGIAVGVSLDGSFATASGGR